MFQPAYNVILVELGQTPEPTVRFLSPPFAVMCIQRPKELFTVDRSFREAGLKGAYDFQCSPGASVSYH